jgi:hypothetical protein
MKLDLKELYWVWVKEDGIGTYSASVFPWSERDMRPNGQMRGDYPRFEPVAAFEHQDEAFAYANELNTLVLSGPL